MFFLFLCCRAHLVLHGRTHAFPSRRSAYLDVVRLELPAPVEPLVRQVVAGVDHAQIRRAQVIGQPGGGDQGFALEIDHRCLPLPSARSEEHTSELQSLMRTSYALFCWKKKKHIIIRHTPTY